MYSNGEIQRDVDETTVYCNVAMSERTRRTTSEQVVVRSPVETDRPGVLYKLKIRVTSRKSVRP